MFKGGIDIKKGIKILLILLGIFLATNAIMSIILFNVNVGSIMVLVFSVLMSLWLVFERKIESIISKNMIQMIRIGSMIMITVFIGICMYIGVSGATDTTKFNEEVVIVLGCGIRGESINPALKSRLDKCLEYVSKNSRALIIVSGGQGPQEDITEAEAMRRYLVNHGVSNDKIFKEEKATSTLENFKFSKEILDRKLGMDYQLVYITNDFHSYRAGENAKKFGLKVTRYSADTEILSVPIVYAREVLAVVKLWVIGE